jgi:hypothetical protein
MHFDGEDLGMADGDFANGRHSSASQSMVTITTQQGTSSGSDHLAIASLRVVG